MAADLATLLVSEQMIARGDLERIARGLSPGQPVWAALLDSELIGEDQLYQVLESGEWPRVDESRLQTVAPPEKLLRALPAERALRAGILPLDASPDGREAVVAMVDPSDRAVLDELCRASGLEVAHPLLAHARALRTAVRRVYGPAAEGEKVELDPQLAAELRELKTEVFPMEPSPLPPMPPPKVTEKVVPLKSLTPTKPILSVAPKGGLTPAKVPAIAVPKPLTLPPPSKPPLAAAPSKPPLAPPKPTPIVPAPPTSRPPPPAAAPPPKPIPPSPTIPRILLPPSSPPPPQKPVPPPLRPRRPSEPRLVPPPDTDAMPSLEAQDPHTPRLDDARADDARLIRALIETVETLAVALEARVGGRPRAKELARLSRRVGRQLGCPQLDIDQIGVAALLFGVDRALRLAEGQRREGVADDLAESLGWAAAGEGGIVHALRVLTSGAGPFGRSSAGPAPLGARVISACSDFLELQEESGGEGHLPDLDTVSQLLRAGSGTAPVVDALMHVLEARREATQPRGVPAGRDGETEP